MRTITFLARVLACFSLACIPLAVVSPAIADSPQAAPPAPEKIEPIDAWTAAGQMGPGINLGNTFDNTAQWETGWGSPRITKEFIQSLAHLGFKTVRLPVAWDTFAKDSHVTPQQFQRINEVANWITDAGMYCVVNIHWDGGWIDSDSKERYPTTYHTFSPDAEKKFRSYWDQISRNFAGKNEKLIFESLNEESTFTNEGSPETTYATLTRVNQIFIDTVRQTGGNNAQRILIVAGCNTDIDKTCKPAFKLPKDTATGKLLISIHYYTPWPFVGMNDDASWAKMKPTWGSADDIKQLNQLFDRLNELCVHNNIPAFIGEFSMCSKKEGASSIKWTSSVCEAATKRKMIPVLWDTGSAVSRRAPYAPSKELLQMLPVLPHPTTATDPAGR